MKIGKENVVRLADEVLVGPHRLAGLLAIPDNPSGVVLFAHVGGSSRRSVCNQYVAQVLQNVGLATLLVDLLDKHEEQNQANVRNIDLLVNRLDQATTWVQRLPETMRLPIAYFGADIGAAAALACAARRKDEVNALVLRGARPDLVIESIPHVTASTLLIVGEEDDSVLELNEIALKELNCNKQLKIIHGATYLFTKPGTLAEVGRLTRSWFLQQLDRSDGNSKAQFNSHFQTSWLPVES